MNDALKLGVYFGDSQTTGNRLTSDALIEVFDRHVLAASGLFRGLEGFGLNRRVHAERFPDVSTDLPLMAVAVDRRERILAALEDVDRVVAAGLVTLEEARLATGAQVARAGCPDGPGRAAQVTLYCGRAERVGGRLAYRDAVEVLRRHGAAGTTVLLGVDGTYHGRRERATLFSANRHVPMMIIAVGAREPLERSLPELRERLPHPLVTLQAIAQLKHDGDQLEELPHADPAGGEVWQAICVYARQSARWAKGSLHTELSRRLREHGAAGATTIRGHWGFSSGEPPHGDRFGRLPSDAPSCTVYIDRASRVAELWPLVDEVTAEHGIVTSLFVPAYRERRGGRSHGRLTLPPPP